MLAAEETTDRIQSLTRRTLALSMVAALALASGCGDVVSEDWRPCDYDGLCDSDEDCLWCQDCCVECSLGRGDQYEFIVTDFHFPIHATDARENGLDLDGDGHVDNNWGFAASLLEIEAHSNSVTNQLIQDGKFILLARVFAGDLHADGSMAVQLFYGDHDPTHDATEDNLTGSGHALIAPGTDETLRLCGTLSNGVVTAGPGTLVIPFPMVDPDTGNPVAIRLDAARIARGSITPQGWVDLVVGGGITKETFNSAFVPPLLSAVNAQALSDPDAAMTWYFSSSCHSCGSEFDVFQHGSQA